MQYVVASLILAVCLLLLLRMVLRPQARERLDRVGRSLRDRTLALWDRAARAVRRSRQARRSPAAAPKPDAEAAEQLAREVIRRARGETGRPEGDWEGNVFRPRGGHWSGPPQSPAERRDGQQADRRDSQRRNQRD